MNAAQEPWVEVGPGAWVRQSVAYRMNSVLLRCDGAVLLVDPGVFAPELEDIAAQVGEGSEVQLLVTHSDWDHVLGRLRFARAPLVAHRRFHETLERGLAEARRRAAEVGDALYQRWPGEVIAWRPDVRVGEEHTWVCGNRRFTAYHSPGHCPDQLVLLVPGDRLLVAGDMLSDLEIPILNGSCAEYLESLARVEAMGRRGEVETLVPGHGAVARGWSEVEPRIERDRAYLQELHRRTAGLRARRSPLEQVQADCAGMDYLNKQGWPPMADVHRQNVEHLYRAAMEE